MAVYESVINLKLNEENILGKLNQINSVLEKLEKGKHETNVDVKGENKLTESAELATELQKSMEQLKSVGLENLFDSKELAEGTKYFDLLDNGLSDFIKKVNNIGSDVDLSGLSSQLVAQLNTALNAAATDMSLSFGKAMDNVNAAKNITVPSVNAESSSGNGISSIASALDQEAEDIDEEAENLKQAAQNAATKINEAWKELRIEDVNTSQQSDLANIMSDYSKFFDKFRENLDSDKVAQYDSAMDSYKKAVDKYQEIYDELAQVSEANGGEITYSGLSEGLEYSDEYIKNLMATLQEAQNTARNAKDIIKTLSSDEGIKGLTTLETDLGNNTFGNGMTQMQNMLSSVADLDTSGLTKANEDFEKLIETYQKLQDNFQSNGGKINLDELVNGEGLSTDEVVKFGDTYKKTMDEVKASTKQASTEFKEINNFEKQYASFSTQIENVGNGAARGNLEGLNTELSQTIEAMREAAQAGNLDAFNQSAQEATRITNELNSSLKEASSGSAFFNNLGTSISSAFSGLTKIIGTWQISRLVRTMASDVVSSVNEIDTAMNQLQIVTGATSSEMESFFETAVQQAKDLGQSVTDVLDSIQVYSRLGYDLEEASELAEYTSILSNVADVETSEATQGLTSVIKGFDLSVEDAEHVADVLIEVGQNYAVSASEILEAFTQSSAAFGATGTSFEEAAAIIAAGNAAVQDASTVGA